LTGADRIATALPPILFIHHKKPKKKRAPEGAFQKPLKE